MNCKYCHDTCIKHVGPTGHPFWYCANHNKTIVKFLFGEELTAGTDQIEYWSTTIIGFKYGSNYYHACFFDNNHQLNEKFRIDKILNAYTPAQYAISIVELDFQPLHVTPENVSDKLSKYLAFL